MHIEPFPPSEQRRASDLTVTGSSQQMPSEYWHPHESSQESTRAKWHAKPCGVSSEPNRTLEKKYVGTAALTMPKRSDANLQIKTRDEKEGDISRK